MIFDITISDGSTSVSASLTYRRWVPGRDSWVFSGGSGLAGVSETDWEVVKAAGQVNMFADFSGSTEQLLFYLTGFGSLGHDPAVGDDGPGLYSGPPALLGNVVSWEITNIR
jgi:hypothetical protein